MYPKHSLISARGTDGFFDAGMLQQALRASKQGDDEKASQKAEKRRHLGRKLTLAEY